MISHEDSYWYDKNVLITGVNGFIGGNLAKALVAKGANVFGLVRNSRRDTLLFYEKVHERIVLIAGDVTDVDCLSRVISEERIASVFHLGAQVEVGVAVANPLLTFETNIKGTYCLMEAVRRHPRFVESVIIASTDKSYGSYPKERMPYKEDYPLLPRYPYDVSKACADMIAQSYASEVFELPIVVTRFCNIFGPGQLNFSAVLPDSIRACLGYGTFVPRGNGRQVRDFIFIDDVVDLYLRIGAELAGRPKEIRGGVYNAGTNTPRLIREVLETVYRLTGQQGAFEQVLRMMQDKVIVGEIECQYMDYEKVNRHFGWAPQHSFERGVEKTIEWFRGYLAYKHGIHPPDLVAMGREA